MYLEKEAIEYFRKYDFLKNILLKITSHDFGEIPSRRIGRNMEFEQYREYIPGDEVRDIDWKVYARSGKAFIKNYGSDASFKIRIILDNSLSMNYPGGPDSKLETAKKIIAVLTYLLINAKNNIFLSVLNETYTDLGRISLNYLEDILRQVNPANKTDIAGIKMPPSKEICYIISDGWWDINNKPDESVHFLINNKINFLHILSQEEISLNFSGNFELTDSETSAKTDIIVSEIRSEYIKKIEERIRTYRTAFLKNGLLYDIFPLHIPYYVNLKNCLDRSIFMTNKRQVL